ncbi:EFR1 family ferrodoxin [Sediminispirochaeta smaragdinae]|uniref:4Fe-4S ferredoxin iron-sulfur binding domain protein n=1 Tax=Sediminispirochaeta smaragdinae (strain DSM 11293 / JCM 15392 / SEBR 4228) TaxID=573413 RepID=E1R798_SEDSS|nr:EFR1 family ferrodoxin [Sediminispirochaeta smaragdinae]ADK82603.1 4Fe-4S ferredoxin iron-sulfur binding domain protein [Sediminispirochaeta smaragdinae DSM 11293]
MNVSILVFSPSGHTLKVAKNIEKAFKEKDNTVRLINITGKPEFLYGEHIKEALEKALGEYDLLCIGGPLYAGHVEHTILQTIGALPVPDEQHSKLAVPFVSYGGVHSSVALEEMGKKLRKKGYKSILGIKIAAKHTLTSTYANVIYEDKPGPEEEKLIAEAVEHVISIIHTKGKDAENQSKAFKYAPPKERFLFKIFSQEKLHRNFKQVRIDAAKCIKCKKCISACPVDMFTYADGEIVMHRDNSSCILCAECFHTCPAGAIEHPYIEMGRKRLNDGFAKLEEPASALYGGR